MNTRKQEVITQVENIKELKKRIEGYKMLFDFSPNLYFKGIVEDREGTPAFCEGSFEKIFNIGNDYFEAKIDDNMAICRIVEPIWIKLD